MGVSVDGGIAGCVKPLSCSGSGVSWGSALVAGKARGAGPGSLIVAPGIGWARSGVLVVDCNTAQAALDRASTHAAKIVKITLQIPLSST